MGSTFSSQPLRAFGLNHILLSGWNESGFDYGFPQYRPNPNLGTEEELRDGVRAVIAAGGHVAFYVNARLCNAVFPDREALWKNGGIQNRDGSPWLEQYGSRNQYFASMCSQAELWQSELLSVRSSPCRVSSTFSMVRTVVLAVPPAA